MSEQVKEPAKRVKGPKAAVAGFTRKGDGQHIWVFPRDGESRDDAIKRVMRHNNSEGSTYELCQ